MLIVLTIVSVFSLTIYEFSGVIVTKKVSSAFRVIIEISKVIFVWIFELIYYDYYYGEFSDPKYFVVFSVKLLGYFIIIFGNLLLNEIVQLKCFELNRYYGRLTRQVS